MAGHRGIVVYTEQLVLVQVAATRPAMTEKVWRAANKAFSVEPVILMRMGLRLVFYPMPGLALS
jgi:hypothetical protein